MVAPATTVRMEPEIKERLQRLAKARERSTHWLMKRAIEEYVEREEAIEESRSEGSAA